MLTVSDLEIAICVPKATFRNGIAISAGKIAKSLGLYRHIDGPARFGRRMLVE